MARGGDDGVVVAVAIAGVLVAAGALQLPGGMVTVSPQPAAPSAPGRPPAAGGGSAAPPPRASDPYDPIGGGKVTGPDTGPDPSDPYGPIGGLCKTLGIGCPSASGSGATSGGGRDRWYQDPSGDPYSGIGGSGKLF